MISNNILNSGRTRVVELISEAQQLATKIYELEEEEYDGDLKLRICRNNLPQRDFELTEGCQEIIDIVLKQYKARLVEVNNILQRHHL
jgi:hypothetical protein